MQRPLIFTAGYWRYLFRWQSVLEAALAGFGAIWLVAELVGFFSQGAADWIRRHPLVFVGVGGLYVVYRSWPRAKFCHRVRGHDIQVELRVDDIFRCEGALVVSATRTFESNTADRRIAADSLQGQFTAKYYSSWTHLKADIDNAIGSLPEETRKSAEEAGGVYPVGTTLRVTSPKRAAYFVALPGVNEFGNARATFEDLKRALPSLWECAMQRGDLDSIAIPVVGSGRARILAPRAEIVREIVQSFVAACAAGRFCDSLIIVVSPADFHRHEIDVRSLDDYIKHVCEYATFGESTTTPLGTETA